MKKKFFTANVDVAAIAAFGGLTAISFFALFFEEHGIRLSIVALAISLWGFLSLKQMDTEQETQRVEKTSSVFHKPQHRKNRRRLITAVVLILISGVILSGAIKMTRATQMDKLDCTEQPRSDSIILEKQETPCPKSTILPCSLDAAE